MIGKTFSYYRIIDKLGKGGMGIVYLAMDLKLERKVALKFLPREISDDIEAEERLRREAKVAASLSHPNIVTIYEINEYEGNVYIVMEYVEGKTLKEILASGKISTKKASDIVLQIAEGLSAAHKKGIVHRDIKPANVILSKDGNVKTLDFGLAKLKGVTKLTKNGTTLGTVEFMSPEQVQGKAADNRSDIWSLGVLFYLLLTGQLPFKGESDQAVLYGIVNKNFKPVNSIDKDVPLVFEKIIKKALIKDPNDRYQDINEMISDIQRYKKQETMPSGTVILKRKKTGRKKIFFSKKFLISLPIIITLILLGYINIKKLNKSKKSDIRKSEKMMKDKNGWMNSIAVMPFSNLSADKTQEYFCEGMTEDIITKLSYIKDLKVISRTSVMRFKNSKKNIKEIGLQLGVRNVLEGSVRKDKKRIRITAQLIRVADDAHLWAKNYDRKLEDIFAVQDEVSKAIANSLEVTLSPGVLNQIKSGETKNMEAYEYYLKGIYIFNNRYYMDMNDKNFNAVLDMFKKALKIDPNYARVYRGLSWVYGNYYIFKRDIKYFNKAFEFAKKAKELAPDSVQGGVGHSYSMMGKYDKAYSEFKKSIQNAPNNAILNYTIGFYYIRMGLYNQSIKYCTRAIEIDPFMVLPYITKARCLIYLRNYDQAEKYIKKALDLFPDQIYLIRLYCKYYLMIKNYDKAEKCIEKLDKGKIKLKSTKEQKAILFAFKGEKKKALALGVKSSLVYSLLGMKEIAIKTIQKSSKKVGIPFNYLYLINSPFYNNLRDDIRFQKIVADAKNIYEERLKKYGDL